MKATNAGHGSVSVLGTVCVFGVSIGFRFASVSNGWWRSGFHFVSVSFLLRISGGVPVSAGCNRLRTVCFCFCYNSDSWICSLKVREA